MPLIPALGVSSYVGRALPVGRSLVRRGFRPFRAARIAASQVGTPANLYARVVREIGSTLRRERRSGGLLSWLLSQRPKASTASTSTTTSTPTGTYMPGAIPNVQVPSGAFQTAPGTAAVPGMQMPVEEPALDAEVTDEEIMVEEQPFYTKPLFLLAAAGAGYYLWSSRKKKAKAPAKPKS